MSDFSGASYRVGLLVDSLIGGGAERVALNFAEKFMDLGHDAHVFMVRNEVEHDTRAVPLHALSETGVLSKNRVLNKRRLAARLKQEVAEVEADGRPFDFFISNAEDMDRLAAMASLPHVFIRYRNSMVHYFQAKLGDARGIKRAIRHVRWLAKFRRIYGQRHIVTVSKALQDEILKDMGIRPASITTIYNPFNFERLRRLAAEGAGDLPKEPYIVYAARISSRKNQELLIRAYARSGVPHQLVLLGGTTSPQEAEYEARMRRLISELGLEGRVLLPGFRRNPYPWVSNAALFAMSSDAEGLPTVLIESLILGTPVVSTDCPTGPREILTGALAPFLSPVGDVERLAANIRAALAAYPAVGEAELARFRDDTAIATYVRHFENLKNGKGLAK